MAMRAKQLADLVRDNLNAGFVASELTPNATAVSEFAPFREDPQLQTLTVIAFPFHREIAVESRGSDSLVHRIGIFVAMARGVGQTAEQLAEYCAPLVEQIGKRVIRLQFDAAKPATCMKVEHDPLFDHQRLRIDGVFEAIIGLELHESEYEQ